jgi:hypothetical protein
VSSQLHVWPLCPCGESSHCTLNKTMSEPQSQSGCDGEETNPCSSWVSNNGYPVCSPLLLQIWPTMEEGITDSSKLKNMKVRWPLMVWYLHKISWKSFSYNETLI